MKDLLQVAARGGSGSAARALGSGLAGMRTGTRRLLIAGVVGAFLVYLGWDLFSGMTDPRSTLPPASVDVAATPLTTPSAAVIASPITTETGAQVETPDFVGYSVDIREVAGLTESTPPGTVIDLWVTWDPPLTKVPKLQRVLRVAVVRDVVPPVTPDGPYVAVLSVSKRDVESLLWADRYGSLSATTQHSS